MRFLKGVSLKICLISFGCIIILLCSFLRFFNNLEQISYDLRFSLRPHQDISEDIVIIQISDDTLQNLGKWPLPRDFHASLIDVLRESGAKMVVFDILFPEATAWDDIFSSAITKSKNIYLPMAFYFSDDKPKRIPAESQLVLADISEKLKTSAVAKGHINVFVDSDGKVRRIPLFIKFNQSIFPNIALKAACDWLGLNSEHVVFEKNRVIIDNRLSLPLSSDGSFLVNYPDRWNSSFKHLSYFELLKSYADFKRGIKPEIDLSIIKNKICFIGLTATGTSDLRATPLENIYPMMGLQVSVFNSVINKSFICDAGLLLNALINLLVFFLSLFICLRLSPLKASLGSIILALVYFAASVGAFALFGVYFDLFFPLLIAAFNYIFVMSYRFFSETRKRQLLEKELDIARAIQKSFLPEGINQFCGLNISSFIQPAKFVAGDLYDVLIIDDKKIGIFIADVSGKGVSASLIMAQTISLFRIFARQYSNCSEVLRQLNKECYGKFAGRFVTSLYIIVDTEKQNARVSSAGHSPLLLYKKSNHTLDDIELEAGMPLGIMDDIEYNEVEFHIAKGDRIIVFTDGLHEARNKKGQELGLEHVKKLILKNAHASSEKLLEAIRQDVFRFSKSATQHDDITIIVLSQS